MENAALAQARAGMSYMYVAMASASGHLSTFVVGNPAS